MAQRELDVVVFGATGDTGTIGCACLFYRGRKLGVSSWAPAARNLGKLREQVLDKLEAADPGTEGLRPQEAIQADSGDYASLLSMCRRTKLVIACAGPFSEYGEGVVRACVEAGTHYVDVTGEVPWVEKMQQKYGKEAEKKGLSIVNFAGYDSVPPDLSTFLAAKALEAEGEALGHFEIFCGGSGGALPTGTLNTVIADVDKTKARALNVATLGLLGTSAKAKMLPDRPSESQEPGHYAPESLKPTLNRNLFWTMVPGFSTTTKQVCLPHFMAPVNVHSVHHTAAEMGYGEGLSYRERMGGVPSGPLMLFGLVPAVGGMMAGFWSGALMAMPYGTTVAAKIRDLVNTPLQQKARRLVLDGFQSTGTTSARGYGTSKTGNVKVEVELDSDYDPGLGFTMLSACTTASLLLKQYASTEKPQPGFHTPVVATGGKALAGALQDAGVRIAVTTRRC